MSKIYKTKKHEIFRLQEDVTNIKCDLCGEVSRNEFSWSVDHLTISETQIHLIEGDKEGDPGSGRGITIPVDLCPDCFKGKLIPWLKSQGADIKELDWDRSCGTYADELINWDFPLLHPLCY
jgi:hypothetical protein